MTNTIKEFINLEQFAKITQYAEYFVTNKALPNNIQNGGQLVMVLQAGQELGLSPVQAISGIAIINGVITVHGTIAGGLMKSQVDWDVLESTSKICKIKIWNKENTERSSEIEYKIEEAQNAGLLTKDNWKKYPQDMLFYKCLARARKRFCPELLGGVAIYEDYQELEKGAVVIDGDEENPLVAQINACETLEALEAMKGEIAKAKDNKLVTVYARKQVELKQKPLSPIVEENAQTETANISEQSEAVG